MDAHNGHIDLAKRYGPAHSLADGVRDMLDACPMGAVVVVVDHDTVRVTGPQAAEACAFYGGRDGVIQEAQHTWRCRQGSTESDVCLMLDAD